MVSLPPSSTLVYPRCTYTSLARSRHVVDPDDVYMIGLQALQAILDRAQRRVVRIVVDHLVGTAIGEHIALLAIVARRLLDVVEHDAADQIGRAHVGTPVTNAHLVCRLLHEQTKMNTSKNYDR